MVCACPFAFIWTPVFKITNFIHDLFVFMGFKIIYNASYQFFKIIYDFFVFDFDDEKNDDKPVGVTKSENDKSTDTATKLDDEVNS